MKKTKMVPFNRSSMLYGYERASASMDVYLSPRSISITDTSCYTGYSPENLRMVRNFVKKEGIFKQGHSFK